MLLEVKITEILTYKLDYNHAYEGLLNMCLA